MPVKVGESSYVSGNHYITPVGRRWSPCEDQPLVWVQDGEEMQDSLIPEGMVMRSTVRRGIAHAALNLGTRPMPLVTFHDLAHDARSPDVVHKSLMAA
jgi:hypothetical protein